MSAIAVPAPPAEAARVVRRFLESLGEGRLVDALDLFSTDAVLIDDGGHAAKGIRAIAASLLGYRTPRRLDVERIETRGPDVEVAFRREGSGAYRASFSVHKGRIRSARVHRLA